MKNNILLYILLAGLLLRGCTSDDGRLDPTYADIDWFAIQPSDDPLDGLRYDIYKKNRISVYYNDTIGSQYRGMSGYGDSVIHYEILDLCYTIEENNQTVEYTLSADRDKLYDAIKFVQQKVIPAIPAIAYPKSLLLVKELILNTTSSTTMRVGKTWTAMMTTAIGAVEDIQGMTADEQDDFAAEITGEICGAHLYKNPTEQVENFYALSEELAEWEDPEAGHTIYGCVLDNYYKDPRGTHPAFDIWYGFGFLAPSPDGRYSDVDEYTTPTKAQDLAAYLKATLLYGEALDRFRENMKKEMNKIIPDFLEENLDEDDLKDLTEQEFQELVDEYAEHYMEIILDKYQVALQFSNELQATSKK
ncbi:MULTISPECIES: hypothetical protein [Butyricimonas]|uniref:hypothetical protein n=1 Tax=Butyricimonas TaxID=574697 RepID=UPI0007FB2EAA|nr:MULTISPECIES: hypothetical protein [Butyricimonas]